MFYQDGIYIGTGHKLVWATRNAINDINDINDHAWLITYIFYIF